MPLFFPLPSTQTIKAIGLIFFFELALNMHFNPRIRGGGTKRPLPRLHIDSDPPAFKGLNIKVTIE